MDLPRELAMLQARVLVLDKLSESFTELSDMQTHRRLKMDLSEFLITKSTNGEVTEDPMACAEEEIRNGEALLMEAHGLYDKFLAIEKQMRQQEGQTLSLSALQQASELIPKLKNQFSERLASLKTGLVERDWLNGDLRPELLFIAKVKRPSSPIHKLAPTERIELWHFVHEAGNTKHVREIELLCGSLIEQHATQTATVRQAFQIATRGDFLQARAKIDALPKLFRDLGYDVVLHKCSEWTQRLNQPGDEFARVESELSSTMKQRGFFKTLHTLTDCRRNLRNIESFNSLLSQFQHDVSIYAGSDFTEKAGELVVTLFSESQTRKMDVIKRRRWARWKLVGYAVAIIATSLIAYSGLSQFAQFAQNRTASEDRAASEVGEEVKESARKAVLDVHASEHHSEGEEVKEGAPKAVNREYEDAASYAQQSITPTSRSNEADLLELSRNKAEWPPGVSLTEKISWPAIINGEPYGTIELPVGTRLKLLEVLGEYVKVSYTEATNLIPTKSTDLVSRVPAARQASVGNEQPNLPAQFGESLQEVEARYGKPVQDLEPTMPATSAKLFANRDFFIGVGFVKDESCYFLLLKADRSSFTEPEIDVLLKAHSGNFRWGSREVGAHEMHWQREDGEILFYFEKPKCCVIVPARWRPFDLP